MPRISIPRAAAHGAGSAGCRRCGASTSASQASGSTSLSFAVMISVAMAAARSAPRSEPANSQDLRPRAKPLQRAFGRVVGEADPAVVEEARKPVPTLEHVVDRLGDGGRARQAGTLLPQPGFQGGHKRRALLLADAQPLVGGKAIDAALDIEQHIDALDRLQRDRRDRGCLLAAPGIGGDVGQLEELPPRMRPTQRRRDRPRQARRIVKLVVAAISVGLQNAGEVAEDAARDVRAAGRARRNTAPPAARDRRRADRRGHRSRCAP